MGKWSYVPQDLLTIIARKLKSVEDFVAFRGVSSPWRSAASKENFAGTSQIACALYASKLVPISEAALHHLRHRPSFATSEKSKVGYRYNARDFVSKGWLFAISEYGDTCLFHPFSCAQINLPHASALPDFLEDKKLIINTTLSASPSFCTLVVLYRNHMYGRSLAFWRLGKEVFTALVGPYKPHIINHCNRWVSIACNNGCPWWVSIACNNEQLYSMDLSGTIAVWDIKMDVPVMKFVVGFPNATYFSWFYNCNTFKGSGIPWVKCSESPSNLGDRRSVIYEDKNMYLVESNNGEIFTVGKYDDYCDLLIAHRIDVTNKKRVLVEHLGSRALFFGLIIRARTCFFIETSEISGCMPNQVYFDKRTECGVGEIGFYSFPDGPLLFHSSQGPKDIARFLRINCTPRI